MHKSSGSSSTADAEVRVSWLPMVVIAMGQMLMSFNLSAIPVSMSGMVESIKTPPTAVGTAVVYLNFFSDSQLTERLSSISAATEQLTEALRVNAEARTRALKVGFLILSAVALIALVPCRWLPDYRPGEIPSDRSSGQNERS
jgi:hypothetical protein